MKRLDYFFSPKNIAVIGASRTPGKIGYAVMQNLIASGYKGKVLPINPKANQILGVKAFKSILQVKTDIDLTVICIPAKFVPKAVEECGKKNIEAVLIISAGFKEMGNAQLTKELENAMKKCPKTRFIGPNCLGIIDCHSGVDTLFLPEYRLERPEAGDISFISQSGALGSAVLDWAGMREYGIAKFVSYGNAMDVDESDLLEYFVEDKQTKVVVMYIEGVKDGKKFFETAKRVGHKKPVIVLKGGVTKEGGKAATSHTASLAGDAMVFDAVFKQTGLVKAESLLELFDFARVLSKNPAPKGNRIQIITDGGGYGVVTADAAVKNGLALAKMSKANVNAIKKVVPDYVVLGNPMDLTGDVTNERYQVSVEEAIKDDAVDMVVVILLYQVPLLTSDVVNVITDLNRKKMKPIIAISVGGEYSEVHKKAMEREGVVNFSYPEEAIKSLKALLSFYDYKKNRK